MESLPLGLLNFLVKFINSYSGPPEDLVPKMLKVKKVQRIIIECICKLEPILAHQVLKLKVSSSDTRFNSKLNESSLLSLANDAKHLMENFESIQSKVGSLNLIITDLDKSLETHENFERSDLIAADNWPLMGYLNSISPKKIATNDEIEELSSDIWTKHIEVEKMLKAEMLVYQARLNSIENKYLKRLSYIKEKCGLKIQKLEIEIQKKAKEHLLETERILMTFEEKISKDYERHNFEQNLLEQNFDLVPVTDMLSAVSKIKSIAAARQILERNRIQDEKIIKGLNNKIQVLALKYSESQELMRKVAGNNSSLSWCLGRLIGKSSLSDEEKNDFFQMLIDQNCEMIEERFKQEGFLEKYTIESVSQKFEELKEGVHSLSHAIKNENIRIRLAKLVDDNKLKQLIEIEKKTFESMGKTQKKSPKGKQRKSFVYTGTVNSAATRDTEKKRNFESPLDGLKKALDAIDEEIQTKNKNVAEDIINFTQNLKESLRKRQSMEVSKNEKPKIFIREKAASSAEVSTQTEEQEKKPVTNECESQTIILSFQESESQTTFNYGLYGTSSKNSLAVEESYGKEMLTDELAELNIEKTDQSTQTEKKIKINPTESSSILVRGLLRRPTPVPKTLNILKKHENASALLAESLILKRLSNNINPLIEVNSLLGNPDDSIEIKQKLEDAAEQYRNEFGIQSQFFGYKKLEFVDIQKLWEEVINRRIAEGEKDKISVFLRGYLGTDEYEGQKQHIIEILQQSKKDEGFNGFYKEFNKKARALNRWKKLIIKLFIEIGKRLGKEVIEKESFSDVLYRMSKYYKFIKKFPELMTSNKHTIKKSETSLNFKSDRWINTSNSPRLIGKRVVTSKYKSPKHNQTYDRMLRIKTPQNPRFKIEIMKFPTIKYFKKLE